MNKQCDNMNVLILVITLAILLAGLCIGEFNTHICTDPTHQVCDGECGCDGLQCKN